VEGSVSVLIEINARGVPTDVRVVSRSGERSRDLDRAVVSAARGWRFDPARRDGRPVPGEVILPVDFERN
jgi:protein TonB